MIERRNPLPPGKYWVDVFQPATSPFLAWMSRNRENITVNATEHISYPEGDWILFTVRTPTIWEGPGYPTVAGPNIKTKADTSERPPPEELPSLEDAFSRTVGQPVKLLVIGAGLLLALKLLKK